MDIWILVLVLLVIAILLFLASFFGKNPASNEVLRKKVDEQAETIRNLQQRLNSLDQGQTSFIQSQPELEDESSEPIAQVTAQEVYYGEKEAVAETEETMVEIPRVNYDVSDRNREDIIRYYSQGYTLKEIAKEIPEEIVTIQYVIDEYIENR